MQRDTVLRWIDSLSALIARILRRDPGASVELARQQLDEARRMLLGPMESLVPHLDPARAADLLADPHRIYGYAQLLALESALVHAAGVDGWRPIVERAVALSRLAAARLDPPAMEWLRWADQAEAALRVEALGSPRMPG